MDGAGIWLHREDSHGLWPDGVRASILKRGSQFIREIAPKQPGLLRWQQGVGHYEYIPEHDLEARELEDAAMQAAADQEEETAEEEGAGNPASLEDQAEPPSSKPRGVPATRAPTAQELTHTPYKAWCERCVDGKGREDPHRRRSHLP